MQHKCIALCLKIRRKEQDEKIEEKLKERLTCPPKILAFICHCLLELPTGSIDSIGQVLLCLRKTKDLWL